MQSHLQVLKPVLICHKIIMDFYKYLLFHENIAFSGTSVFFGKDFSPPVSCSAFVSELTEILRPKYSREKRGFFPPSGLPAESSRRSQTEDFL